MKFMFHTKIIALLSLALAGTAANAQPAQPVSLNGTVQLEKQVTDNGVQKKVLSEPKVVVPGDRLLFVTAYHNAGKEPIKDFVVTNPVPAGVALAGDGAESLSVSVDGGKTWGLLTTLKLADGAGGMRAALPGDVTHVRWVLPLLQPGASGKLNFYATVR